MSRRRYTHKVDAFSRRRFLGGAGVAIGLPLFDSLVPRSLFAQAACAAPKRLLVYHVPNGFHMASFTPSDTGESYSLNGILEPLSGLRRDLLVLSGLTNRPGKPRGAPFHITATASILTCTTVAEGTRLRNAVSVDQRAAEYLADCTAFRSLELGVEQEGGDPEAEDGYSGAYRAISWPEANRPATKIIDPRQLFDRMFAGFDSSAADEAEAPPRDRTSSVLDYVLEEAADLRSRLAASDRIKLDQYLTSVRDVERRLSLPAPAEAAECNPGESPGQNLGLEAKLDALRRLMVLAFQCDLTRVISFMADGRHRRYSFLDRSIDGGHHALSHHRESNAPSKLTTIGRWEIEQFADLVESLKQTTDIDGSSILDNSMVMLTSECGEGRAHDVEALPVILAGRGGGALSAGRHVRYRDKPIADLYISILRALGLPNINRFGETGTAPLPNLT